MKFLLIIACLLVATTMCLADKKQAPSPEELSSRARHLEEIWTDGTPPAQMRAEIQVPGSKGDLVSGSYTFTWFSPSRWKEEIQLPGYERIRVGDSTGYWQKSSLDYEPETISQLDKLLHLKEVLKLQSKETLGKVKELNENGVSQQCIEIDWNSGTGRKMCFDASSGSLLSIEHARGLSENARALSKVEYGTFKSIGDKLVPFEMRGLHDKAVVATVKVVGIEKISEEQGATLSPPPESEHWLQCEDMGPAQIVYRVQPVYPASARSNGQQGWVILYAVIEADGSLSHLTVIQRATPSIEAAALSAVSRWHYKPATCGQLPIRVETTIEVGFSLRR